jgi:hypothetical protein
LWESGSKEWYLFGFKYNNGEWLEELKLMKKIYRSKGTKYEKINKEIWILNFFQFP